MKLIVLVYL